MKHLIVYAHPHPESLNHAILNTTISTLKNNGHDVFVRDLYELNFQPVLQPEDTAAMKEGHTPKDIKTEQEFINDADVIIFIYPIWWTGLPAILKGYVDRVFAYGYAYAVDEEGIIKLLKGKKGLIINTHGTPNEEYDEIGYDGWLKVTSDIGIFDFTGIETVEHLLFGSIGYVHEEEYKEILNKVEDTINFHFS